MAKAEGNEVMEFFQECENTFGKEEYTKLLSESNVECTKTVTEEGKQQIATCKQFNNNHHVVHLGIVIVLLTIYLGMTSVQKCLVSCVENTSVTQELQPQKVKILDYLGEDAKLENTHILERLLEYKNICKDLEIFTKNIKEKRHDQHVNEEEIEKKSEEVNSNGILNDNEVNSGDDIEQNSGIIDYEENSGSSGNGDCANRKKNKNSKYSLKTKSAKNGFNKHNKSAKAKSQKNEKKDLNLNKKNSTAEPIIYLFALVFIYLLLKAASDINQHYKSRNKNDKRLRRCSLQSYAQTHRPDRRASKGISTKSLPKF